MWLALALLGPAVAADRFEQWRELHDALLAEAIDGDLQASAADYERMVRNAAADDPMRGAALYWLGRARWQASDVAGAKEALREGVRAGSARNACLELLDQIELEQGALRALPVRWSFDDPTHALVHPWWYRDAGSIRVQPDTPSGPALVWTTQLDPRRDDQLHLPLDRPSPAPRGLRFIALAEAEEASLRLVFLDEDGHRWAPRAQPGPWRLPAGEPVLVEQRLDELVPLDADVETNATVVLARVILQDVTAFYTQRAGTRTLLLDDFEVW